MHRPTASSSTRTSDARSLTARFNAFARSYLAFVAGNRRFIGFGFAIAFFSSFGQTFFISLFNDGIQAEFGIADGRYGTYYGIATLASGFCMISLGRRLDDMPLPLFATLVCVGMIVACVVIATVPLAVLLVPALFLLRLTGQGLMSHTSMTTMARYFDNRTRGKAISVAATGFAVGEGVLPSVGVALIAWLGWRGAWGAVGAVLAVVLIPLILWLLKGHRRRHGRYLVVQRRVSRVQPAPGGGPAASGEGRIPPGGWRRADVLRDPRFYMILPAVMSPGFILTGLFFHQLRLVEAKGWELAAYASAFTGFAATRVAMALLAGPAIDRWGARRLVPVYLWPLALGILLLWMADHNAIALAYLVLAGVTAGFSSTIVSALWAEMYGVAHLGAIRAMSTAIGVGATALAPAIMGWMLEFGVRIETIAILSVAYIALATCLAAAAVRGQTGQAGSNGE